MQRYLRGGTPYGGTPEERPVQGGISALQAAVTLGETVRAEHGREGVKMYVGMLSPLIPRVLLEQTARSLGMEPPPPEPPRQPEPQLPPPPPREEPRREKGPAMGGMKPEQLLKLMQGMKKGEGGGLDPMLLLNLMKE